MTHSPWFPILVFFITMGYGFACGLGCNLLAFLIKVFKKNIVVTNVVNFLQVFLFGLLFFLNINFHNYGQVRFYLFAAFCFGFWLHAKTVAKPFAKLLWLGYNKITKATTFFRATTLGKKIFK